jgi:hypothetical protein
MGTSIAKLCGNRSRRTPIESVSTMNAVSLAGTGRAREAAGRTSGVGHSEHPDITPHAQTARGYPPQFLVRSLHWICWRFSAWLRTFSLRTMSLLTMTLPPFTAAVLSSRTRLSDRAIVHSLHGGLPEDCLYAPQKDANDSPARIRVQTCEQHVRDAVVRAICLGALAGRSGSLPGDRQNPGPYLSSRPSGPRNLMKIALRYDRRGRER